MHYECILLGIDRLIVNILCDFTSNIKRRVKSNTRKTLHIASKQGRREGQTNRVITHTHTQRVNWLSSSRQAVEASVASIPRSEYSDILLCWASIKKGPVRTVCCWWVEVGGTSRASLYLLGPTSFCTLSSWKPWIVCCMVWFSARCLSLCSPAFGTSLELATFAALWGAHNLHLLGAASFVSAEIALFLRLDCSIHPACEQFQQSACCVWSLQHP